jgi:hypothetical protein
LFEFLVAALFVKRVKLPPALLLAHVNALDKVPARYIVTRMELETFAFSFGSQFLYQNNVLLGNLSKRLFITMVKN